MERNMSVKSKTLLKVQQIREEITTDQNFNKDIGGSPTTMLKLDHGNNKVVLGDGTDITVEIAGEMATAIDMGSNKITSVTDPRNNQAGAT